MQHHKHSSMYLPLSRSASKQHLATLSRMPSSLSCAPSWVLFSVTGGYWWQCNGGLTWSNNGLRRFIESWLSNKIHFLSILYLSIYLYIYTYIACICEIMRMFWIICCFFPCLYVLMPSYAVIYLCKLQNRFLNQLAETPTRKRETSKKASHRIAEEMRLSDHRLCIFEALGQFRFQVISAWNCNDRKKDEKRICTFGAQQDSTRQGEIPVHNVISRSKSYIIDSDCIQLCTKKST